MDTIVTVKDTQVITVTMQSNAYSITKLPITSVTVPAIEYGSDHFINITVSGANPAKQHIVTLADTNKVPAGVIIKKLLVSATNTVLMQVANDGSGAETTAAFTIKIQIINF